MPPTRFQTVGDSQGVMQDSRGLGESAEASRRGKEITKVSHTRGPQHTVGHIKNYNHVYIYIYIYIWGPWGGHGAHGTRGAHGANGAHGAPWAHGPGPTPQPHPGPMALRAHGPTAPGPSAPQPPPAIQGSAESVLQHTVASIN